MSTNSYIKSHSQYTANAPIQNDTFFDNYSVSDKERIKRRIASSMLVQLLRDMAHIKSYEGARVVIANANDAMTFLHTKTCEALCEVLNIDYKKFIDLGYDVYEARDTARRFKDILANAGFNPSLKSIK